MSFRYSIVVLACIGALYGCNNQDSGTKSIAGVWDFNAPNSTGATYEFGGDGSVKEVIATPDKDLHGTRTLSLSGTYNVNGSKITISMKNAAMETDDPNYRQQADQIVKRLNAAMQATPDSTGDITWKDNDHWTLVLTTPGYEGGPGSTETLNLARHS
jgi:hypothetical protein